MSELASECGKYSASANADSERQRGVLMSERWSVRERGGTG